MLCNIVQVLPDRSINQIVNPCIALIFCVLLIITLYDGTAATLHGEYTRDTGDTTVSPTTFGRLLKDCCSHKRSNGTKFGCKQKALVYSRVFL
jgi:hypothetical protein